VIVSFIKIHPSWCHGIRYFVRNVAKIKVMAIVPLQFLDSDHQLVSKLLQLLNHSFETVFLRRNIRVFKVFALLKLCERWVEDELEFISARFFLLLAELAIQLFDVDIFTIVRLFKFVRNQSLCGGLKLEKMIKLLSALHGHPLEPFRSLRVKLLEVVDSAGLAAHHPERLWFRKRGYSFLKVFGFIVRLRLSVLLLYDFPNLFKCLSFL
jgi:hypothetical protein